MTVFTIYIWLLSFSFEKNNDIMYNSLNVNFKNVKKSTKSDTITNVQSPTMIVKCSISWATSSGTKVRTIVTKVKVAP